MSLIINGYISKILLKKINYIDEYELKNNMTIFQKR